jgi:hypothetical protein
MSTGNNFMDLPEGRLAFLQEDLNRLVMITCGIILNEGKVSSPDAGAISVLILSSSLLPYLNCL